MDYIILCIKPHDLSKLDISNFLHKDLTVVSILAGVKINDIKSPWLLQVRLCV